MLSDLTESVRGPQHRCTPLLAGSKQRGRCRHNPNLTPIMQFLWGDTGISQRCRTSKCSNQGLSQCFPTRAPQNIVRGSLRNVKINKHSWNIATNFKYPSKYRNKFQISLEISREVLSGNTGVKFVRCSPSLCFGFAFKGAGLLFYGFLHGKEVWKKLV